MNKRQFVQQRQQSWKRFEQLLDRLERSSRKNLLHQEITEFSALLRELANDLAVVRSRSWQGGLPEYLNELVARGHNTFYTAPPGYLAAVVWFLTAGFPRLLRQNIGYFWVSCALFFLPGAISWAVVQNDPSLASRVLPTEQLEMFESMYRSNGEDADDEPNQDEDGDEEYDDDEWQSNGEWDAGFSEERAGMAGFYAYHNTSIALQCFARGILLGVGTVYTLLFNGIVLGAISGYIVGQGHSERFLSFVVSHGSFELTAIAVAGAGGLMLGNALIHPGQRTRLESLRVRGFEAVQIAIGAAVMLFIAALIEAFWSPSGVPNSWKYAVGGLLWAVVVLYLAFAGRGREEPTP